MSRALKVELLKLRRSRVVGWTGAAVAFFALMSAWGPAVWAPDVPMTWEGLLSGGTVWNAAWWGVLVLGLAAAHLFGVEFGDGTAPIMLTAPVPRRAFVLAKLVVLAGWAIALTLLSVVLHVAVAAVLGADGYAPEVITRNVRDSLEVALLLYLTLPSIALVSMIGRGYIAPMLFSTAMTAASWSITFLGEARWFPWSMPATVLGGMGPPGIAEGGLGAASWAITIGLFVTCVAALLTYVERADVVG